MTEDDKLYVEIDRARQAQDLIEHPLWREAWDTYRQRLQAEWSASPALDTEGRERIWLMLKSAEVAEQHLKELIETGKMATLQLDRKRSAIERAKGWISAL